MKFQKGQSGNPKGRPPVVNSTVRRAGEENKTLFKELVNRYLLLPTEQVKARLEDPTLTTLERLIAQSISDAVTNKYLPKYVLEAAMGPLIEDPTTLTPDERAFLTRYRELRDASAQKALPASSKPSGEADSS